MTQPKKEVVLGSIGTRQLDSMDEPSMTAKFNMFSPNIKRSFDLATSAEHPDKIRDKNVAKLR
jgi:hypothetical protein